MSRENDWIHHFRDRKASNAVLTRLVTAIFDADPRTITIATRAELKNLTVETIPKNVRVATTGVLNLEAGTNRETVEILHFQTAFQIEMLTVPYTTIISDRHRLSIVFLAPFDSFSASFGTGLTQTAEDLEPNPHRRQSKPDRQDFDHFQPLGSFRFSLPYTSIIQRFNPMSSVFIYNFISLLHKDLRRAGLAAFSLNPCVRNAYEKTPAFAGVNS